MSENFNTITSLEEITQVKDDKRDQSWENRFFQILSQSKLQIISDGPQVGPDNWPYLLVSTHEQASEDFAKILQWTTEKGVGLAINPTKEYPDFVFTYGMLWSFRETGWFFKPTPDSKPKSEEYKVDDLSKFKSGSPTKEYLPEYVRTILREFFRDQGVHKPRILVATQDGINFDLIFSLDSLGSPKKEEYTDMLEAFSWFFPPHYSLVLAHEEGLPQFLDL